MANSTNSATLEEQTVKILIVDDHPLVRQGLDMLISQHSGWSVSGHAGSTAEALQQLVADKPDLVLVDVSLQDGSGLELIKEVRARDPEIRMLVLSNHDESVYAERALRAGASGYVNKLEAGEKLLQAIEEVLKGKIALSRRMTERMVARAVGGTGEIRTAQPVEALSDRELEVFELIGRGLTTRQIASKLFLSPKTVETYRESIKTKLDLANSTQLVRTAVRWVLEGA